MRQLYKVMAYKDEYEVARLHLKQAWHTRLTGMFAQPQKIYYHLHPPLLRSMGLQRKLKLGPWFTRPLRLLRRLKTLRGRHWDLFGYAKVRRAERQLIPWYRQTVMQVLAHLDDSNHTLAVVIANAPEAIRGYEDIKLRRLAETRELVAQHLERFPTSTPHGELATPR
jgi:indolepyruvate ferredoxin oxidoreductase